ncbi:MAG: endolytic transglycosylase MltG [Gammaproteobacteria bacterium]|nr:endolytic transglycosylase MltG [Gammaproteobacteria bacterium]
MRKYFLFSVVVVLSILIFVFIATKNLSQIVIIRGDDFHYVLQTGASAQDFIEDIHRYTGFRFPILLKFFIRFKGVGKCLLAGEYIFPHGSTMGKIIDQVTRGDVVYHPVTLIDGWRFDRIISVLENTPFIQHTLVGLTPQQIAEKIGIPFETPEGMISPNTYYYTWGASDLEILKMAYQSMVSYLAQSWFNRDQTVPYKDPYQALIVASILEKEASLPQERRLISGIIVNRFKKHMKLQMDSTVIYGLGSQFNGDLTKADLKNRSPYNTYVHYGLPPSPIAMPSFDAINAALHPAKTDVLYFVSKNNGTHVFSHTLAEQNKAVAQYQFRDR